MKRRTALVGLATTAVGSAVAFGSGAFTNFRAERQVNIAVSNDTNAAVTIEANDNDPSNEFPNSFVNSSLGSTSTSDLTDDSDGDGNQELSVPGPTAEGRTLEQYAGQITRNNVPELITEKNGQVTLNLDETEFAPGFNQGVVFFEDLIRVANRTINDIELSAIKTGTGSSDFDLLYFQITDPSVSPREGEVRSVFDSSNTVQLVGSNVGGLTPVIDSADAELNGQVDIKISVDIL